jgi:hypothetical protein
MHNIYFWKFSPFKKNGVFLEEGDGCWRERASLEFGAHFTKIERMWDSGYEILICKSGRPIPFYKYAIFEIYSRIRDV